MFFGLVQVQADARDGSPALLDENSADFPAPDQDIVGDLGAEDLSLGSDGESGGAGEGKQESFHTLIKTFESYQSLSAAGFPALSGNLILLLRWNRY